MGSVARNTGFGVAALAAGLLLAGPQALGVATADDTGSQSTHSAGPARGAGAAKATASSGRNTKSLKRTTASAAKPKTAVATPTTATLDAGVTAPVMTASKALTPSAAGGLPNAVNGLEKLAEGAALQFRKTFFNSAPTIAPVQTTGQTSGAITGSLNIRDANGDKITTKILQDPQNGSVEIHSDGTYTYTPGSTFTGQDSFVVKVADSGTHINLADPRRPIAVYANVVVGQGTQVYPTFTFVYGTGSQWWSSAAKASLQWSATQVASTIVVTTPTTISLTVLGRKGFDESGKKYDALASASSPRVNRSDAGFYDTVVQQKIITGVDANGKTPDGRVIFNFTKSWGYGNTIGSKQFDFESVAMHELLHALGWTDGLDEPGDNTGTNWTTYDQFITDSDGTVAINPTTHKYNTALEPNIIGKNGGLYFNGANAVEAYGGPVPIFTPGVYDGGSSIAHTDDNTFNGTIKPRDLMNAQDPFGAGPRTLSAVDRGVLQDLGYTLVSLLVAV